MPDFRARSYPAGSCGENGGGHAERGPPLLGLVGIRRVSLIPGKTGKGRRSAPPTRCRTAARSRFLPTTDSTSQTRLCDRTHTSDILASTPIIGPVRQDPYQRHPRFHPDRRGVPQDPYQPHSRFDPDHRGFVLRVSGLGAAVLGSFCEFRGSVGRGWVRFRAASARRIAGPTARLAAVGSF